MVWSFCHVRVKGENYGKGKVDPNAVNSGGKDRENKKRALMKLLQKTKSRQKRAKDKVANKTSLTKYKSKFKVQLKHEETQNQDIPKLGQELMT